MIELLKHILVAIIQGIAEILPISSSAHIFLVEKILHMEENLTFSIFLHFGSLIAIIFFFRKELWKMIKYFFSYIFTRNRSEEARYYFRLDINLVIASIPAAICGFLLKSTIEQHFLSLLPVGISLIITAIILYIVSKLNGQKELKDMKWHDSLIVGLFQVVGLVPGISRSGITISGLKTTKYRNEDSANFAFLMFIPVTLGSFLSELLDVAKSAQAFDSKQIIQYIIGVLVATIVTYFAISFLLKIIRKGKLWYFSYYCLLVGIMAIIWSFF